MNNFSVWTTPAALGLIVSLAVGPVASAQESGFMEDYSVFEQITDEEAQILAGAVYVDELYMAPQLQERMKTMTAVMIDQPEVFLDPDSPYKGAKPDVLKILADNLRQGVVDGVSNTFEVVDEPGPGVMYVHWAITRLYLAKKKKKFYAYTPIGFVADGAKNAMIQDIWKKVDIVELGLEMQWIDSENEDILGAVMIMEGARKDKAAGQKKRDPVTVEELDALMQTMAARIACRMKNGKLEEAQRADCPAIAFVAEKKK